MKNRNPIGATAVNTAPIVLVAIAVLFLLAMRFAGSGERTIAVVSSQSPWGIDIQRIKCLSLNRRIANIIFGNDYSNDPKILSTLQRYFPNANVSLDDPSCPYVLTFVINPTHTHAVHYLGRDAQTLATFVVSKRSDLANGMPTDTRSYKNLYLFRSDLTPLDVFEIGLKAFLRHQPNGWQTIKVAFPTHA